MKSSRILRRNNLTGHSTGSRNFCSLSFMRIMSLPVMENVLAPVTVYLREMVGEEIPSYTLSNTIDDLRGEYRFSPYHIMEIAERIKTASVE